MSKKKKTQTAPSTEDLIKDADELSMLFITNAKYYEGKINFKKGLIFGLVYGVVGNLFVQFLFPVLDAIINVQYNNTFGIYALLSIVTLVAIISFSAVFILQIRKDNKAGNEMLDIVERVQKKIQLLKEVEG